jgi:hypothetical protein
VPQVTGRIGDWVLGMNGNAFIYQPADRFWPFQFIEAGMFVALTAAALGATIWLLHRCAAWTALGLSCGSCGGGAEPHRPSRRTNRRLRLVGWVGISRW